MAKKTYPIEQSRLYRLESKKKLAELLGIDVPNLIALTRQRESYRVFTTHENGKARVIEEPQGQLKLVHARLFTLLSRVQPPVYLHSGVKGRSYVSNAREHVGRGRVLKTDISKFYPSTTHRQVFVGFLREFRCKGDIAKILADLCTYQEHVPTGSAISMPMAFLAHKQAFDALYVRMLRDNVVLTVYVDDITLSGAGLMRWHLCPIKKTFSSTGMRVHKNRFFSEGPAAITGTIVKGDKLRLPNRRHQRIAEGIHTLGAEPSRSERQILSAKLIGQVHEAASVDEDCRARAHGYLRLISKLVSAPDRKSAADPDSTFN
ncbi:MAG TPA: reverse transcriptase family protein [Bryobacteraceae bacterium]|jgi:hypothetical protein|nr:reverse transcriptase family protein [Bryobacteraceae bacterium]